MNILAVNLYNMYNQGETMHIRGLRNAHPKDNIKVAGIYSYLDDIELKRLNITRVGGNRPGSFSKLAIKAMTTIIQSIIYRITGWTNNKIIKAYIEADVIVSLGGDNCNDAVAVYYPAGFLCPLFIALILKKK